MSAGKRAREDALLADKGTFDGNLKLLVDFVLNRENVRSLKEAGRPRPWTDDPVIEQNHFCNIYRIDDRVTQWLLKKYYSPIMQEMGFHGYTEHDLWLLATIARLINWPPSLEFLMNEGVIPYTTTEWNEEAFKPTFQKFKDTGVKTFTGAYMLYNGSRTERNAEPKTFFTGFSVTLMIRHAEDLRKAISEKKLAKVSEVIQRVEGINTFIAGQIVADLTYLNHPGGMTDAEDLFTWAPLGPGSQRGLNWLHCLRPIRKTWKEEAFIKALIEIRNYITPMLGNGKVLSLHDVQNIMCEYSKYMRIRATGESWRRYTPEKAYTV